MKIFPISSKTYWRVEEETEKPVGFPSLRYTGILAFRSWLRYATVAERERHLDMTLNAFHGLFNGMDTWSTNEWKEPLVLTKDFIQSQVLDASLKKLKFVSLSNHPFLRILGLTSSLPSTSSQFSISYTRTSRP